MKELIRTNDAVIISFVEALMRDAGIALFRRRPEHERARRVDRHPAAPHHGRRRRDRAGAQHPCRRRHRQRDQERLSARSAMPASDDQPACDGRRLPPRQFLAGAAEGRGPSRRHGRDDAGRRGAVRLCRPARRSRRRRRRRRPRRRVALSRRARSCWSRTRRRCSAFAETSIAHPGQCASRGPRLAGRRRRRADRQGAGGGRACRWQPSTSRS